MMRHGNEAIFQNHKHLHSKWGSNIRGGSLVRLADPFLSPYVAHAKTTHTSRTGILGRFHARIGKRTSFRNFGSEVGVGGPQMSM